MSRNREWAETVESMDVEEIADKECDLRLAHRLAEKARREVRTREVRKKTRGIRRRESRLRRIETSGARLAEQMSRFRTKLDMPKPSKKTAFSRLLTVTAAMQAVRARGRKKA